MQPAKLEEAGAGNCAGNRTCPASYREVADRSRPFAGGSGPWGAPPGGVEPPLRRLRREVTCASPDVCAQDARRISCAAARGDGVTPPRELGTFTQYFGSFAGKAIEARDPYGRHCACMILSQHRVKLGCALRSSHPNGNRSPTSRCAPASEHSASHADEAAPEQTAVEELFEFALDEARITIAMC